MIELASPISQPLARPPQVDRGEGIRDDRMEVARMLATMIGSAVAEVPA